MIRFVSYGTLALLFCLEPARAEEKPPAPPIQGPASEATVSKLFDAMDMQKMMIAGAEAVSGSVDERISQQLPGGPGDKKKQEFLAELKALRADFERKALDFAAIKPALVKIYQDTWTEDEAQQLLKFYSSPVGHKAIRETPSLMQKAVGVTQGRIREMMPEFNGKISDLFRKYYPEMMNKR